LFLNQRAVKKSAARRGNCMRWPKIIAWITLVCWLVQSLVFTMLFTSTFTHIIVQCFVSLGAPLPETSAFLSGTMKVLAWPIHSLFPSAWSEATFVEAILLLAANSLIWGAPFGTVLFFWKRKRPDRSAT
jgi:hypothetical protein